MECVHFFFFYLFWATLLLEQNKLVQNAKVLRLYVSLSLFGFKVALKFSLMYIINDILIWLLQRFQKEFL